MAIQIRRGSNAEWEVNNSNIVVGEPAVATDSKRAFIGTASGAYMELANLEAIAPAYDPGNSYMIGDYVSYQGKLYVCIVPTSGAWNASAWQVTSLGQALAENAYINYETYTMSGDIVSFPNGAGGIPVKDLKVSIEAVQSGSGDPSPDNVRPISGWGEVNVNVTGINVWDEEWESGDINVTDGSKRANTSRIRSKNFIPVQPSTTYYSHNAYSNAIVCFYDASKGWVSQNLHEGYESAKDKTFTTPSWCHYIMFYMNGTTYNNDISINYPSTDHAYHAYNGQTYTIDLNGTRYGGTLDVTTGVLTITHSYVLIDGSNVGSVGTASSGVKYAQCDSTSVGGLSGSLNCLCSSYKITSNVPSESGYIRCLGDNVYIYDNDFTNKESAIDILDAEPAQYVYELATPQTVQLTPTQVTTLLWQNNIWADSGEVEVTYRISNV